jgi:hypothetical protein
MRQMPHAEHLSRIDRTASALSNAAEILCEPVNLLQACPYLHHLEHVV